MSDHLEITQNTTVSNLIPFPIKLKPEISKKVETPIYDSLVEGARSLDIKSAYKSSFDYSVYKSLELRYTDNPMRGGIITKTAFRLANSHSTCQQCLYAFEIDTYGRGCIHDCVYCYAKAELTVHGYWNNPIPVPIDINEVRKAFYTVFETDKPHKLRGMLKKRIPLRIGSMSDSFMWMDQKYKVTQELLKILKFYNYPYVVFTRSDLAAHDDYIALYDKDLASIQFSISSTNDSMVRKVEPGAPSAKKRLAALKKLNEAGIWTTVRINPLFPIYPDGYFTDPNFDRSADIKKFDYFSFDMIDEIAASGTKSVLAGFVRLSGIALNGLERTTGVDLRDFHTIIESRKSRRDYHYSDLEIRYYYEQIKERCDQHGLHFSTCYIGNGEKHFWKDQDLWSNKKDCCNIKGQVAGFKSDSREILFEDRLRFTSKKDAIPSSDQLHTPLG